MSVVCWCWSRGGAPCVQWCSSVLGYIQLGRMVMPPRTCSLAASVATASVAAATASVAVEAAAAKVPATAAAGFSPRLRLLSLQIPLGRRGQGWGAACAPSTTGPGAPAAPLARAACCLLVGIAVDVGAAAAALRAPVASPRSCASMNRRRTKQRGAERSGGHCGAPWRHWEAPSSRRAGPPPP